eukprot:3915161-Pyramimonas_sp.AAC.1
MPPSMLISAVVPGPWAQVQVVHQVLQQVGRLVHDMGLVLQPAPLLLRPERRRWSPTCSGEAFPEH